MSHLIRGWAVCAAIVFSPSAADAVAQQTLADSFAEVPGVRRLSGRLIVRPVADPVRHSAAVSRLGALVQDSMPEVRELIVTPPEGVAEADFAAWLLETGDYEYVHPDWWLSPIVAPDDPKFGQQWHHRNMMSEFAWNVHTGGTGYTAAWVDTGVDLSHPDLAASLVPGYNSVDRLKQVNGGDVTDINGHGTAVAGCIGAIGNNGVGVAGVMWDVNLMPVRGSNQTNGNALLSDLLDGARWAIDNGAQSVSVSYTGVENPSVSSTGDYIHSQDGSLIWAAGNSSTNLNWFDWPNVIIVGATNSGDKKTSWSSFGPAIDVVAPGDGVLTTARGGGYGGASGTSFSAPLVNGVIAMIRSNTPSLNVDDVTSKLFSSCDDLGVLGEDDTYGHGRVNVARAIDAPGLPPTMFLYSTLPVAGQVATLTVTGATPGETVFLYYSKDGIGVTPEPSLGIDLDLANAIAFGSLVADPFGEGDFLQLVPGGASGGTFFLQAAEAGAKSVVLVAFVQ